MLLFYIYAKIICLLHNVYLVKETEFLSIDCFIYYCTECPLYYTTYTWFTSLPANFVSTIVTLDCCGNVDTFQDSFYTKPPMMVICAYNSVKYTSVIIHFVIQIFHMLHETSLWQGFFLALYRYCNYYLHT